MLSWIDAPTTDAPSTGTRAPRIDHRTARIVAVVAGLLGFLMALVTPLLPVNQSTAELNWPQGEQVGDVAAPLVSYVPIDMDVTVPCPTRLPVMSRTIAVCATRCRAPVSPVRWARAGQKRAKLQKT